MFGAGPKVKHELSEVQRKYRTLRVPGCFVSYTTKGVILRQNPDVFESQPSTSTAKEPRWV